MKWINVKDEMPTNEFLVLIACGESVTTGWHDGDCWRDDYDSMIGVTVTHWMPIPTPPSLPRMAQDGDK